MRQTSLRHASVCCFVTVLGFSVLSGCGVESGPKRYQISGTVTYQGRPVPKGFITFSPDTSQGNSGPGGGAAIVDGKYRTARGKGVVGGPHVVRIIGYDGVAVSMEGEELSDGQSLFTPFQETIDFPMEDTTHDFTVPAADVSVRPRFRAAAGAA